MSEEPTVPRPGANGAGDPARQQGHEIGWVRAIASGLAILAVAFGATVLSANAVLTRLSGVSRNTRQYLASVLFLAVVGVMAWALRRLQARGLI